MSIAETFKNTLGTSANNFLFMSATPPSKKALASLLEINEADIEYIYVPNSFPVANRPIFHTGKFDLSYKNIDKNLPDVVEEVDEIIAIHKGDSVLIHSGNYKIAMYIKEHSKYSKDIICPTTANRMEGLELFKTKKGSILVSPSLMEGISLDGDFCRVTIVVKVPFGSLADARTQQIVKRYPARYAEDAARKVVQGCGRGVRSEDDWAWTYILDRDFSRVKEYTPNWFKEALFSSPGEFLSKYSEQITYLS